MDLSDRIQEALDDGLSAANKTLPTSSVVRAALRVAVLRGDPLAEFWLGMEMNGVEKDSARSAPALEIMGRHVALIGSEQAGAQRKAALEAFIVRRKLERGKEEMTGFGVGELERHQASMQSIYEEPVTPGMTPLDTGMSDLRHDKVKATLLPHLLQQQGVLERVRAAAYQYLLDVEAEILRGQDVPDVIAQGRRFVDTQLALLAPAALDALNGAQDRLAKDDHESLSHAATSCRRAIKALADELYPAGPIVVDGDGVKRVMDDEHYRNRLTEYVRARSGKSTRANLLVNNITALGTRLKSLDDLASKGVHSEISRSEAESCVSWTYMLAADLLRVREEAQLAAKN